MSRQVTIAAGYTNVMLPNGKPYPAGASGQIKTVTLTDDQFAQIDPNALGVSIIDDGVVAEATAIKVTVASGVSNLVLPNGGSYSAGQVVTLSASEFSKIPANYFTSSNSTGAALLVNNDSKLVMAEFPLHLPSITAGTNIAVETFTPVYVGVVGGSADPVSDPGTEFAGNVTYMQFLVTTPVTTSGKTTTLSFLVNGVAANGGALTITSATATPAGKVLTSSVAVLSTDEVQTLTVTGTPTGGYTILTFGGQHTDHSIVQNASAATVQAALVALSTIGAGNVVCSGGPLPGTPITITFQGALANAPQALITTDAGANWTGGTSPTSTVTEATKGSNSTFTAGQSVEVVANTTTPFIEGDGILQVFMLKS